ncbi:MAG: hypothetical protein WC446_02430 [Candidatus Paceibacterota bacterium]|jgi:hypothetical protein
MTNFSDDKNKGKGIQSTPKAPKSGAYEKKPIVRDKPAIIKKGGGERMPFIKRPK